jgi:periplasmic divalent cation tolerance protein
VSDVRLALVTAPAAEAPGLARRVVEERLAACATLFPGAGSVYRWKGGVEEAQETMLLLKTTSGRIEALRARVLELHPYELPEFLVVAVEGGLEGYLAWVRRETAEEET